MEEWKQIVIDGEKWNYEVSTEGNVKNMKGHFMSKKDCNGYHQVILSKNGTSKLFYVHRLVLETFEPTDDKTLEVNHINEDTHDNRLENLEWMTHDDNIHHGTGIERSAKTREKRVKCVETGVIYDSILKASVETGLDNSSIGKCCRGLLETCGKLHWEFVE